MFHHHHLESGKTMVNEMIFGASLLASAVLASSAGVLGQIPGADEAIDTASRHGYEAVLVVVTILTLLGGFAFIIRYQFKKSDEDRGFANQERSELMKQHADEIKMLQESNRETENRMAARIDKLEDSRAEAWEAQANRYADLADRVVQSMEGLYKEISAKPYFCPNAERLRKLEESGIVQLPPAKSTE